jgi:hypothetical protein
MDYKNYTVKGFDKLNEEFDKLDSDARVSDYNYYTLHRNGDGMKDNEYEFQVIFN